MPFPPGWNTLEGTERWGDIFTILGLVALALLVFFDVLAFLYGRREKVLANALAISMAAQREQEKEKERQENAVEIGDFRNRLRIAEQVQNSTMEQLKESSRQLGALHEQQVPRHLSEDQKVKLTEMLSGPPPPAIEIVWPIGLKDGQTFSDDLISAMRSAGWHIGPENILQGVFTGDVVGLTEKLVSNYVNR